MEVLTDKIDGDPMVEVVLRTDAGDRTLLMGPYPPSLAKAVQAAVVKRPDVLSAQIVEESNVA